jgi:YegS/Rv2252/BmrU family lipid kinase
MNPVAFIIHGKITQRAKIEQQIKLVFTSNCKLLFTEYAGHATELVTSALQNGADTIICIGGDGSLNEAINGVMDYKNRGLLSAQQSDSLRIGVLPKGTGNDFARLAKMPFDLPLLKKLIENRSHKRIDLGRISCYNTEGKEIVRYFINIADVGIGGAIAEKLQQSSKFWGATLTYQKSVITSFFTYQRRIIQVKADSFNYEGRILAFIVANGKYFGGGVGIAPLAEINDGKFSIVGAGEISLWDYLKNLGKMKQCMPINHPGIRYFSAANLEVKNEGIPMLIDMDGEFLGCTPAKFELIPSALEFIWPS